MKQNKMEDSNKNKEALADAIEAVGKFRKVASLEEYSKIRSEREKATFAMMMRMNPEALTKIRKEFFVRNDEINLHEFIYIIQKHLNKSFDPDEKREFGMKMVELFRDIDVNGDAQLEWQEFTTYFVEKANLLNKRLKLTSIPHYYDSTEMLDVSAQYRHRHDISKYVVMPELNQFALAEDHKNAIFIFNSRHGKLMKTITTASAPIALEYIPNKDLLLSSCADMTITTFALEDPNPNKKYMQRSAWSTPGVQMALAYMPANNFLYSGGTNGNLYSWNIADRSLISTFTGHTDIVMALTVLKKLNNIASGSLDKTVNLWDSYTNTRLLELYGHTKGVLGITYNPDYRLLLSCGFEHDALVWSPFVRSLIYRLKGHHASLVGIQAIEDTPEIITADASGVFKLWDVRNYQCVQTFTANLSGSDTKDSSKLCCFFQTKLPSRNTQQKEDDSRIYAASKLLFSFDQSRIIHDATTDFTAVFWVGWNSQSSILITASEKTIIIWDALIGSKTLTHTNICGSEITACCLDDRKRKVIIGDVNGKIGVYNTANGSLMKPAIDGEKYMVVTLDYVDNQRCFIAGYMNGVIRIFDENGLEECSSVRIFDMANISPDLCCLRFNPTDNTVVTASDSSQIVKIWDYVGAKWDMDVTVCEESDYILHVAFLQPFSMFATSDSSGNVSIWGSRGGRQCGARLSGFLNQNPPGMEEEKHLHFDVHNESNVCRILPPDSHVDSMQVQYDAMIKNFKENVVDKLRADSSGKPGIDGGRVVSRRGSLISILQRRESVGVRSRTGSRRGSMVGAFSHRNSVGSLDWLETSFAAMHAAGDDSVAQLELDDLYFQAEIQWGKVMAAQTMTFHAENFCLYTADYLGTIRAFSLKYLIYDLFADELRKLGKKTSNISGLKFCHSVARSEKSALPPILKKRPEFAVNKNVDPLGFLGIEFCWAVKNAHDDRIIFTTTTPHGIVTSGADRLVKMWSFEGECLGTLLQSVPLGVRNAKWNVELDVNAIMAAEDSALDEVFAGVSNIDSDPEKPSIDHLSDQIDKLVDGDVDGAPYSSSALRRRVARSSDILGIDFTHKYNKVTAEGSDIASDSASMSTATKSASAPKPLESALHELKSPRGAKDFEHVRITPSTIQSRMKASQLEAVSDKYAKKAGMKITSSVDWETRVGIEEADDIEVEKVLKRAHNVQGLGLAKGMENDELKSLHSSYTMTSIDATSTSNEPKYKIDALKELKKLKRFVPSPEKSHTLNIHSNGIASSPQLISGGKSIISSGSTSFAFRSQQNIDKTCMKYNSFHKLQEAINEALPNNNEMAIPGRRSPADKLSSRFNTSRDEKFKNLDPEHYAELKRIKAFHRSVIRNSLAK